MCRFKEAHYQQQLIIKFSFNTSYVSVQVGLVSFKYNNILFQYILCVGSRVLLSEVNSKLMWFQYILCVGSREWTSLSFSCLIVSIHPMCRFKQQPPNNGYQSNNGFQYILCVGSRSSPQSLQCCAHMFQYILCVGSSKVGYEVREMSYAFQYILCVGSSI